MLMVAAVFAHLVFNGRTLLARLKAGASVVSAGAFTVALVLLYSAALMRPMPGVVAASLDTLAGQVEVLQESRPNAAALPAASMP